MFFLQFPNQRPPLESPKNQPSLNMMYKKTGRIQKEVVNYLIYYFGNPKTSLVSCFWPNPLGIWITTSWSVCLFTQSVKIRPLFFNFLFFKVLQTLCVMWQLYCVQKCTEMYGSVWSCGLENTATVDVINYQDGVLW